MALLVPNEGEVQLLTDLMTGGSLENWTLKLYSNNKTPAETDTAASYTECTFTSYASKSLTRSVSSATWNSVTSAAPSGAWSAEAAVGHTQYGTAPQSWTCGTTGQAVYGYFIVGFTSSKVICAELFAAPRTLASGDTLSLQPVLELA